MLAHTVLISGEEARSSTGSAHTSISASMGSRLRTTTQKLVSLVEKSADFSAMASLRDEITYIKRAGRKMVRFGLSDQMGLHRGGQKLNFTVFASLALEPWTSP
jgi:hypothetical protein